MSDTARPTTADAVLAAAEAHHAQHVHLWFVDITGSVKSVTIPVGRLERALTHGVHFDGSALEGFARVAESDMLLRPDPATFAALPWEPAARLICDVTTTHGEPFVGDPRGALVRVLGQARALGYDYQTGTELEFFLFDGPPASDAANALRPLDGGSYFDMPGARTLAAQRAMLEALGALGIGVVSAHNEIGRGQHEIDFAYGPALHNADAMLTARVTLRTVARAQGLLCSFMPRPSADLPGSGMHTHQTLHDAASGANIFYDAAAPYNLSTTARHFLAGQLAHACGMSAVLAPLVNSYKRLGTSFEAPVYVTWAHINRAALVRVPTVTPGREAHTRLELRCPDPAANVYLASAVMLAAGLEGIRQRLDLPAPLEETLVQQDRARLRRVETLPSTLGEALDALEADDVVLGALGPYISDRYLDIKRREHDAYHRHITAWERARYLDHP